MHRHHCHASVRMRGSGMRAFGRDVDEPNANQRLEYLPAGDGRERLAHAERCRSTVVTTGRLK